MLENSVSLGVFWKWRDRPFPSVMDLITFEIYGLSNESGDRYKADLFGRDG